MRRTIIWALFPIFWVSVVFAAVPAVEIQSETVNIHVKANGCVEKSVSLTMKVNTFQAARTVGEWLYSYNPKLEQVEILKSLTIHRDGKQFPAPENAILDQTPASVENAPDFSNIREKMVSHTALEPGCTVEFQYRTTDLSPHRMGVLEPMGGPWPIHRKVVTIKLEGKGSIHINGDITQTATGVYEVKNTASIRPAFGFSATHDRPFLYIRISDPVKQVKTRMGTGKKLSPNVLEMLKLDGNSTPMAVETTLNHLLNQRLVTVHLEPELTGWTSRSLSRIVASGYATPLEKIILAHRVLNACNVPHTASLKAAKMDGIPIAIEPEFQLQSSLCSLSAEHAWKPGFLLWGKALPEQAGLTVTIRAKLKEQQDGIFAGTMTAERKGNGAEFPLSDMNPVKTATVSGETVLLKTGNCLVKRGKIKLKPEDRQIQINPVLAKRFHLSNLEQGVLSATSIRSPEPCTGVVHVTIEFLKKPSLVLPAELKTANRFGASNTVWQIQGKTLAITQRVQLSPFKAEPKEFEPVNALLIPILNPTASIAFVE